MATITTTICDRCGEGPCLPLPVKFLESVCTGDPDYEWSKILPHSGETGEVCPKSLWAEFRTASFDAQYNASEIPDLCRSCVVALLRQAADTLEGEKL